MIITLICVNAPSCVFVLKCTNDMQFKLLRNNTTMNKISHVIITMYEDSEHISTHCMVITVQIHYDNENQLLCAFS